MEKKNPHHTQAFRKLEKRVREAGAFNGARALEDGARIKKMGHSLGDIFVDFSKNRLTLEDLALLEDFAQEMNIEGAREAMFEGETINETENRQVLHVALRSGKDAEVNASLGLMESFCNKVINKEERGYTGKSFTDIVHMGIGGSDLGPRMILEALSYRKNRLRIHFVSNVDGHHMDRTLKSLSPETTLFVLASKTLTTLETTLNARWAKEWFCGEGGSEKDFPLHAVALTACPERALDFGLLKNRIFKFGDSVGGRFSLWGPVGLTIALGLGFKNFRALLRGAHYLDEHFRNTPIRENIPVQGALLDFFYSNILGYTTGAILPYDQRLLHLPAYLGQLMMESNGKGVDRRGLKLTYPSSSIIWGEVGTNGQHAFFQLLHQGTHIVPCDFILVAKPDHPQGPLDGWVHANCLGQTRALFMGKKSEGPQGVFKNFEGSRPSTTIILRELSPFNLGALLAFYEHRVFSLGHFLNIYSFDQWGVEFGKVCAQDIHARRDAPSPGFDPSTDRQLEILRQFAGP